MLQRLGGLNRVLVTGRHGIGAGMGPPRGPSIQHNPFGATEPRGAVALVAVDSDAFIKWKCRNGTNGAEYPLLFQGHTTYDHAVVLTISNALVLRDNTWVRFRVDDISSFCIVTKDAVHRAGLGRVGDVGLCIKTTHSESYILFNLVGDAYSRPIDGILSRFKSFLLRTGRFNPPESINIYSDGNVCIQFEAGFPLIFQPIQECLVSELEKPTE